MKCSHSPLRATTQNTDIELDASPIVPTPTDAGTGSGWDDMLARKKTDKARSPPIHPEFSPKRSKTLYAKMVVAKAVDKSVEDNDMGMTPQAINYASIFHTKLPKTVKRIEQLMTKNRIL